MDKWNEIRTAYKLARLGTLSATASELGVHRSTVMRHIDTLEEHLGVVLFQRNDKGYLPTEAGLEIMRLGEVTDSHFSQLPQRLQSKEQTLSGKLTITIVNEFAALLMPLIAEYQQQHPGMTVELIGDLRNFNLEYGEADIAFRAGEKPTTPDNVVLPLFQSKLVFCAHKNYLQQYGDISSENLLQHKFIALNERPAHLVWNEWIHTHIQPENIALTGSSGHITTQAILAGCGIGVLPQEMVEQHPELQQITTPDSWEIGCWVLIHRDMMSALKVKKFIELIKQQQWQIHSL